MRMRDRALGLAPIGLLATTIFLATGCGGGGLFHHIGYHDIPDNVISVEELPERVGSKVKPHVAGRPIRHVYKGVRRAHGSTWIYTVKYEDERSALAEVQYTAQGEQIYAGPARQHVGQATR